MDFIDANGQRVVLGDLVVFVGKVTNIIPPQAGTANASVIVNNKYGTSAPITVLANTLRREE